MVRAQLDRVPAAPGRAGAALAGIGFYRSPQVPWASAGAGRYEAENATISRGVVEIQQ